MAKNFKCHVGKRGRAAAVGGSAPKDRAGKKPNPGAWTQPKPHKEIGGPSGPEPTRYGDWEIKGRCVDF
ncbi:MAG: DUF1674 domain-containing protein [Rhodospirillales bacterium]|nr:DUF1674 domain-containing protein [Rhodospirillales bacterium]